MMFLRFATPRRQHSPAVPARALFATSLKPLLIFLISRGLSLRWRISCHNLCNTGLSIRHEHAQRECATAQGKPAADEEDKQRCEGSGKKVCALAPQESAAVVASKNTETSC
jgi:hypothetical protein